MASILVLVPVKPNLHPLLRERAIALLSQLEAGVGEHILELHMRTCPEVGDGRPYSGHAAARNAMLDIYLQPSHTHVLWVDADLVEYPADLATRLHALHSNGIVAPFPMIENTARFYDVRGFLDTTGRYAHPWHPYLAGGDLIPMQAVGCCYLAPAQIYLAGVRYRTTQGETEHYSVCRWAREAGYAVLAVRTLVVQHANLPEYGERWH